MIRPHRVLRALRFLRRLPGWQRFAERIVPRDAAMTFDVTNQHGRHVGTLGDHIERKLYLFGGYELDEINLFLGVIPKERMGVILDVGANIGVHSIAFAQKFKEVVAFEPNSIAIERLRKMARLNQCENVRSFQLALGAYSSKLPLRLVDNYNIGLGTLVKEQIYDRPTREMETVDVRPGDDFLNDLGISRVDAIKIDVQGFEQEVLLGLRKVIERDNPTMWIEISSESRGSKLDRETLSSLANGKKLYKLSSSGGLYRQAVLRECDVQADIEDGDYIIA